MSTTTYYVSPQGNDSASGLIDNPFKTIARAKAVVRQAVAHGMTGDIEVVLRGGNYYLDSTLIFDEHDSGNNGFQIIYRNYPDETPVIYAGQPVIGWQRHSEHIYKARVDYTFQTLYENGQRAAKARHPNGGYNRVEAVDDAASQTQFRFHPGDVPQVEKVNELQVYIWPGGPYGEWNWFTDILPVQAVDFDSRTVTLASETRYSIGSGGSRYFVQGAFELLDAPGEFYFDTREGIVYYWPRQQPIDAQTIIAPTAIRAFAFTGSLPETMAANIRLEGLEICASDTVSKFGGNPPGGEFTLPDEDGVIYFENAEHITISNCHIHNTGMHGVFGNQWVQGITISGCHFHDIGFTGILFNGRWASIDAVNKGHRIINNHIRHTGRVIGYGAGIQLSNSGESRVSHNRVHHTPRYAISLKGTWPGIMVNQDVDGVRVREHNVMNYIHTRGNVVAFNDLSHANTDSQDTGVFEAWGVYSTGNTLHNNWIHDSDIPFSFGFGVYLDDEVSNTTVTNNVIHNLQNQGGQGALWGVFYVKGIGNRFYNNIAANAQNCDSAFAAHGFLNAPNHDLEFGRNILYDVGETVYALKSWDRRKFKAADYNLFYQPQGVYRMRGVPGIRTLAQWREGLDREYDQHSITAAPLFVDADNGDFRLRYDSPAFAVGFQDINFVDIGLMKDFPYADQSEPLDRLFVTTTRSGHAAAVNLLSGETVTLDVTGRTESGYVADLGRAELRYTSSHPNIASVDSQGVVSAISAGVARVTVTAQRDGVSRSTSLDVLVDDAFDRVEIHAPRTRLEMNESMQLQVVGRTRFGQYLQPDPAALTFLSRQPHQAVVNHQGVVTAQTMAGEAEIVALMRVGSIRRQASMTVTMDWKSD
jgi:hypothetical protein